MLVSSFRLQQIFRKPLKTALSFSVTGAYDARRLWYRSFTVLALESSADDTCAAVVNSSGKILSNIVLKQHDLHKDFGGIHPLHAVRAHLLRMPHAIRQALGDARLSMDDIDGIAFTRGPGMAGGLGVCSTAAKSLAAALNKPVVGVHHMQAHALTPFLTCAPEDRPSFPFLALLVSGGHTLLVLASDRDTFSTLATTADESIGNAFDKVSRMLGLDWSSVGPGAALERFCAEKDADETAQADVVEDDPSKTPRMPRMPPVTLGKLMFSYSGLHSAVERYINRRGGVEAMDVRAKRALARAFQTAAVAQLEEKLALALDLCVRKGVTIQHIVVSGGVASNVFLRERLRQFIWSRAGPQSTILAIFPPLSLCTDNAVMIAWSSMHRFLANDFDDVFLEVKPEWDIEDLVHSDGKQQETRKLNGA